MLQLPAQARRIYRTNPLKVVIAQLRFPPILDFGDARVAPFQEAVAAAFPFVSEEQQVGIAIGPQGVTPPQQTRVFRFRNSEGDASIVLARDFVALEANNAYSTFEDFADQAKAMLSGLETLSVHASIRIGLRYLNELRHPNARKPSEWRPFLNEEMLGMVGGALLGDSVLNAVQEIRLRDDADTTLVMRHGYFGAEVTNDDPFYLIDIDCYTERNDEDVSADHVIGELTGFHDSIHSIFESSITDEMRDHLGIEETIA